LGPGAAVAAPGLGETATGRHEANGHDGFAVGPSSRGAGDHHDEAR